jgi:uncharacterized SAM-binding protein YcdF (DUF218 family)
MLKKIFRFAILCIASILILLFGQALIFHLIYFSDSTQAQVQAVVVFNGSYPRVKEGVRLANASIAPTLVISPSTIEKLQEYTKRYSINPSVILYSEPEARTTYENAYYTSLLLEGKNITNIILVTSDYHMPRSYILMRLLNFGKGITINRAPLNSIYANNPIWSKRWKLEKLLYNEMVQFWGSLYELAHHQLVGTMASRRIRRSKAAEFLEKIILIK